jgi:hypothetical protein
MNVIGEVQDSLRSMGFGPLLLAMMFLACYPLALGTFATPHARLRCRLVAAMCVLGFAVMAPSWVHAALFAALAVVAMGFFIVLAWLLSRMLGVASRRESDPREAAPAAMAASEGRPLAPNRPARAT